MNRMYHVAVALALAAMLASPLAAQTSTDDASATENWWDRVGAKFFSDEGLTTVRPEYEIRAQWTGLSADDQAAVLARCAALKGEGTGDAASLQQGSNTGLGTARTDSTATEQVNNGNSEPETSEKLTVTGSSDGKEIQNAAQGTIGYTGLGGGSSDDAALAPVCSLISGL